MGNQTPESSVLRTYIETMFEVPWEEMSEDSTDLDHAQQVLDRDHYGMEKVKERVLEYLAARAMSGKKDAAILCLVGPPGTGKTSIARSIAKATNKNIFVYLLAASGMNQRSVDIGKLMLERCQDVLLKH